MKNKKKIIQDDIDKKIYMRSLRILSFFGGLAAIYYFSWMLNPERPDHKVLYLLLISAELFNFIQISGFWYTALNQKWPKIVEKNYDLFQKTVDILIPVYNEPIEIIEETVRAANKLTYPKKKIFILDDGPSDFVEELAKKHNVNYFRRPTRKGAKAGNLNNALKQTDGDFVAVFDSDHAPNPNFIEKTINYFQDEKIAFVQTPQYYKNIFRNRVAAGAYEQQELFYGPICRGKNGLNSMFCCGTNVIFRREALRQIDYLPEKSITEDFLLSIRLHSNGWKSLYLPEVLAEGLGPEDVNSYFSQQLRWARGGLEIFIKENTIFKKMSISQKIQYFLSGIYWFTGWAYIIYAVMPLLMLFAGIKPIKEADMYAVHFFPYIMMNVIFIGYAANGSLTFRALWFSLCSFPIHVIAWISIIIGKKLGFVVTPKKGENEGISLHVIPHIIFIVFMFAGIIYGFLYKGANPSIMNNVAFASVHIILLSGFIRYSRKNKIKRLTKNEKAERDKAKIIRSMLYRKELEVIQNIRHEKKIYNNFEDEISFYLEKSLNKKESSEKLINTAFNQLEEGMYREALNSFKAIIISVNDPNIISICRVELSRIYLLLGKNVEANNELKKAYSLAFENENVEFAKEISQIFKIINEGTSI